MFNPGDLVRYVGTSYSGYRNGVFTVMGKYPHDQNKYMCIRARMTYNRHFKETDLERVDSIPKFEAGDLIELKRSYGDSVGIVLASNHLGSIIRFADQWGGAHKERFVTNRNIRIIK